MVISYLRRLWYHHDDVKHVGKKKKQEKADRKKERTYQTGSSYIACVSDDWRSYSPLGDRKTPPPKGHTHKEGIEREGRENVYPQIRRWRSTKPDIPSYDQQ